MARLPSAEPHPERARPGVRHPADPDHRGGEPARRLHAHRARQGPGEPRRRIIGVHLDAQLAHPCRHVPRHRPRQPSWAARSSPRASSTSRASATPSSGRSRPARVTPPVVGHRDRTGPRLPGGAAWSSTCCTQSWTRGFAMPEKTLAPEGSPVTGGPRRAPAGRRRDHQGGGEASAADWRRTAPQPHLLGLRRAAGASSLLMAAVPSLFSGHRPGPRRSAQSLPGQAGVGGALKLPAGELVRLQRPGSRASTPGRSTAPAPRSSSASGRDPRVDPVVGGLIGMFQRGTSAGSSTRCWPASATSSSACRSHSARW